MDYCNICGKKISSFESIGGMCFVCRDSESSSVELNKFSIDSYSLESSPDDVS